MKKNRKIKRILKIILMFFSVVLFLESCEVVGGEQSDDTPMTSAEINVKQGVNDLISHSGIYDFGTVSVGSSDYITFTIENLGASVLELTGSTIVDVIGVLSGSFSVIQPSSTVIAPGSYTQFGISFSPDSTGSKTAIISIASNDSNENPYMFGLTGEGSEVPIPEINIKQDSTNLVSGTGVYNFGNVLLGSTKEIVFTIENLGAGVLQLTGSSDIVSITGDDIDQFDITQPSTATVSAGSNVEFSINFDPDSIGGKTATISIDNNDPNENPYTFTIVGVCVEPEINIKQGIDDIVSDTGSYDFGNVALGSTKDIVFTIENSGAGVLQLTGSSDIVNITGDDADQFDVIQPSTATISAGNDVEFSIIFDPDSTGSKSASISIDNNDSDENPYTFTIVGVCVEPEMNIKQGIDDIASDTGSYDFGDVLEEQTSTVVFTIENIGFDSLELTGNPVVDLLGDDADQFDIIQPSATTISAGNDVEFSVIFNPDSIGSKTASVSIANNDSDENPYVFTVTGEGVIMPVPEINVKQGITNLSSGSGIYDFGNVIEGEFSDPVEFTIENTGSGDLILATNPSVRVIILGDNPSNFLVNSQPSSSTVAISSSITFEVSFAPVGGGTRTAIVSIDNNDSNEDPYTFTVTGIGE